MVTTMIQIKKETAAKLKQLKEYSKQTYDEVITDLIEDFEAEVLTDREQRDIAEALKDVSKGRVHRIEDVSKEFGVKLRN